jgi:hypothetical protein
MRRFCAVAILLALACSKQDDSEKLAKSITSWKATLQFVAGARLKNEVREGFAVKTIDEAIEDLEGQSAKVPSKPAEQLIGVAGKLREAIEADDREAITKARSELAR